MSYVWPCVSGAFLRPNSVGGQPCTSENIDEKTKLVVFFFFFFLFKKKAINEQNVF